SKEFAYSLFCCSLQLFLPTRRVRPAFCTATCEEGWRFTPAEIREAQLWVVPNAEMPRLQSRRRRVHSMLSGSTSVESQGRAAHFTTLQHTRGLLQRDITTSVHSSLPRGTTTLVLSTARWMKCGTTAPV